MKTLKHHYFVSLSSLIKLELVPTNTMASISASKYARAEDDCEQVNCLTLRRPDDMHVHFRDGAMLEAVAKFTAFEFGRAIIMPNLKPPVRNLSDAESYYHRIKKALPVECNFIPLMTLYLTDNTTSDDIRTAHQSGLVKACKLYPAGATTNSTLGVTSIDSIAPALVAMEAVGLVLCVHGEVAAPTVDMFDREAQFIMTVLPHLLKTYPKLKIVLEHVTTSEAVNAVLSAPPNRVAATVTAHHLLYSRQALFDGAKLHPHMFCLPVLKRETHRQSLLRAIADDDEGRFFAGTDSAPHPRDSKICPDACAGIFTAHCAVPLYAEAFEQAGMLKRLENFLSVNGANFYDLPLNKGHIILEKRDSSIESEISVVGMQPVIPLRAGQVVSWTVSKEKNS